MGNMTGYRRAAVELHALNEEDRQWVLGNLGEQDRTVLAQYLQELKDLGFNEAASLPGMTLAAPSASRTAATRFERVRNASAADLFAILEHEPSSLIAQFMALHAWHWSSAFLQLFPAPRRERIRSAVPPATGVAPALREYLIDTVGARLGCNDNRPGPAVTMPVWRSLSMTSMRQVVSPVMRVVARWIR